MNSAELMQIIHALDERLIMLQERKARWGPTAVDDDIRNTQQALAKVERRWKDGESL